MERDAESALDVHVFQSDQRDVRLPDDMQLVLIDRKRVQVGHRFVDIESASDVIEFALPPSQVRRVGFARDLQVRERSGDHAIEPRHAAVQCHRQFLGGLAPNTGNSAKRSFRLREIR